MRPVWYKQALFYWPIKTSSTLSSQLWSKKQICSTLPVWTSFSTFSQTTWSSWQKMEPKHFHKNLIQRTFSKSLKLSLSVIIAMQFRRSWSSFTLILNVSTMSSRTFCVYTCWAKHFFGYFSIGHSASALFFIISSSSKFIGQSSMESLKKLTIWIPTKT